MLNEERIADSQLVSYVEQIVKSLGGVSEDFDLRDFGRHYSQKEYTTCVSMIQAYMRIPFRFQVAYVNSGGPKQCKDVSIWVKMPEDLHEFNTQGKIERLNSGYAIVVYIRKSFLNNGISAELFAYAVAHEMSHVVLRHMKHPLRHSEAATDLTAMILGFSLPLITGRVQEFKTKKFFVSTLKSRAVYGSLTGEQAHAANFIIARLQVNQEYRK